MQDLLNAAIANPEDDLARIRYAERLIAHGDPLGEYIKLDCDITRIESADPFLFDQFTAVHHDLVLRRNRLLDAYNSDWLKHLCSLQQLGFDFFSHRGIIEIVLCEPDVFIQHASSIVNNAQLPLLRQLHLVLHTEHFHEFAFSSSLHQFNTLKYTDGPVTDSFCDALATSPYLDQLKALQLGYQDPDITVREKLCQAGLVISAQGASALAKAKSLRDLQILDVSGHDLRDEGVVAILASPIISDRIIQLDIGLNGISGSSIRALVESNKADTLQHLGLWGSGLGNEDLKPLTESVSLPALRVLQLNSNRIDAIALSMLMNTSFFQHLHSLYLGWNNLDDLAMYCFEALPEQAFALTTLDLRANQITANGLGQLTLCPSLGKLQHLHLANNPLRNESAVLLANSKLLSQLSYLSLANCHLDDDGIMALVSSQCASNLRELIIYHNRIGIRGYEAILNSPHLNNLSFLGIDLAPLPDGLRGALRTRFRTAW